LKEQPFSDFIDKRKAKIKWIENKVNTPSIINSVEELSANNKEKYMVKKNNEHGGSRAELMTGEDIRGVFFNDTSFLVENFIEGELVNINGVVSDSEVKLFSYTKRENKSSQTSHCNYFIQEDICGSRHNDLHEISCRAVRALGYSEGPFTIDFIENHEGYYALEISPHFHMINLESARGNNRVFNEWLGREYIEYKSTENKIGVLFCWYAQASGELISIEGINLIGMEKGFEKTHVHKKLGRNILIDTESSSLVMSAYFVFNNKVNRKKLDRIHDSISILIQ
jgi:hypothetical protein